ncbi:hypothetical protein SNEBB_001674 [Seison nebaliae]|nr:hypothetical protein SNEBB_001674 [Seison nebaliae]
MKNKAKNKAKELADKKIKELLKKNGVTEDDLADEICPKDGDGGDGKGGKKGKKGKKGDESSVTSGPGELRYFSKLRVCEKMPKVKNGYRMATHRIFYKDSDTDESVFRSGSYVIFDCNANYTINGPNKVSCNYEGEWKTADGNDAGKCKKNKDNNSGDMSNFGDTIGQINNGKGKYKIIYNYKGKEYEGKGTDLMSAFSDLQNQMKNDDKEKDKKKGNKGKNDDSSTSTSASTTSKSGDKSSTTSGEGDGDGDGDDETTGATESTTTMA